MMKVYTVVAEVLFCLMFTGGIQGITSGENFLLARRVFFVVRTDAPYWHHVFVQFCGLECVTQGKMRFLRMRRK